MARYRTVIGAPALPPRYSFLGLCQNIDDDHRYTEGIQWLPETTTGGGVSAISATTASVTTRTAGLTSVPDVETADPILLWYGEKASTLGSMGRDYEGRVRRGLHAVESYHAAKEFWDGAIGEANGHTQPYLASLVSDRLTPTVSSGISATLAIAAIEQGLAEVGRGQLGMVHMTPAALALTYGFGGSIIRDGNLWRTPMGHLVVADAGYSGNGPGSAEIADGTSQFIYGTSTVRVRLGPVEVKPASIASSEAVDRDSNDLVVLAQRLAVIEWNPNIHLAVELALGTYAVGGTS